MGKFEGGIIQNPSQKMWYIIPIKECSFSDQMKYLTALSSWLLLSTYRSKIEVIEVG